MPERFESGRPLDGKNSLQDFDAKEMYPMPLESISLVAKASKNFLFSSFLSVHEMPFSKCAGLRYVLKVYRFRNLPAKKSAIFV